MTKKPRENRVPIMMSDEELGLIDDWRFENRVATRSDAVRRLVQLGLAWEMFGKSIFEAHTSELEVNNDFESSLLEARIEFSDDAEAKRQKFGEKWLERKLAAASLHYNLMALASATVELHGDGQNITELMQRSSRAIDVQEEAKNEYFNGLLDESEQ